MPFEDVAALRAFPELTIIEPTDEVMLEKLLYQLVDLKKHQLGARELAFFARKFGAEALVERSPEALSHPVSYTDDAAYILECLQQNPRFLRTPIVRNGDQATLGADEAAWKAWIAQE